MNLEIRPVAEAEKSTYLSFDKQLSPTELNVKIAENRVRQIWLNDNPVGVLRWNLFWDELPFLNLIFLEEKARRQGIGRKVMSFWENEMRKLGYRLVITSTQSDETAQDFYRKLGYVDKGAVRFDGTAFEQTPELILMKNL